MGAALLAAALAAPAGARVQAETTAPSVSQFTNPTHRGWKRRAVKKMIDKFSGGPRPRQLRGARTASKDVQVARLVRAEAKRLYRRHRNKILAERTRLGMEAKERWLAWATSPATKGGGRKATEGMGLTRLEKLYRKAFRPRVVVETVMRNARASTFMQKAKKAEEVAA